jgi:hypothetical protein
MYCAQRIFFSDETVPKDDVDRLFEKLEQIQPPPSLIERILRLTVKSPPAPLRSEPVSSDPWADLEGLVARNDKMDPC